MCGQNCVAVTLSLALLPLVSFQSSVRLLQTGRQIGKSVLSVESCLQCVLWFVI